MDLTKFVTENNEARERAGYCSKSNVIDIGSNG